MTIATGETLPEATFLEKGVEGVETVTGAALLRGRKVALFGLPGAYTGTCSTLHVPSFIRVADALRAKGVDDIACVSVNDPFVMQAWGEATGAIPAGIRMLADPFSEFTTAIGLAFDAAPVGFQARSKRYAMLAEDGVVRILNVEASPGACEISAGETLLDAI